MNKTDIILRKNFAFQTKSCFWTLPQSSEVHIFLIGQERENTQLHYVLFRDDY